MSYVKVSDRNRNALPALCAREYILLSSVHDVQVLQMASGIVL